MRLESFSHLALQQNMQELGLTEEILASKCKLKPEAVRGLLTGTVKPKLAQAAELCSVLNVDLDQIQATQVCKPELVKISFRRLGTSEALGYRARWEIRQAQRLRDTYLRLYSNHQDQQKFDLKRGKTIEESARLYREQWQWVDLRNQTLKKYKDKPDSVGRELFLRARLFIEKLGVLTFTTNYHHAHKIPLSEFRGLLIEHQQFPVILINYHDHWAAKLFTLLHEFAHLLYHDKSDDQSTEKDCNHFAAEFLIPVDELISFYSSNNDVSVDSVAIRFGVSRYCAAYAMYRVKKLTESELNEIRIQSSLYKKSKQPNSGGGQHSYRNQLLATSPSIWQFALTAFEQGIIGPTTYSELTGFPVDTSLDQVSSFQVRDQWQ
ncbi:MAG: ImmA/IrrE family metallo-endopeptidase [Candidatus Cloacimonetes bacterium]|nr:ImmA/IrrE family metallo-endopeptidase [Candidatus Cloacimonadota bacterium]